MKPQTQSVRAEVKAMSQPASSDADAAVIARYVAGDVEAFSVLVDRYRNAVYSFAYHLTGDAEEANDLAQEAFVRAYRALPRFRADAKFQSWLFAICANLCKSWLRGKSRRPVLLDDVTQTDSLRHNDDPSPTELLAARARRREVREAIRSLPTPYRLVVILRHLRDMSYEDIAAALNLPVTTVEHRLRTAREMLRKKLEE
jgi:RNA polymerase sigma-70 factor (ECF subfamily)